MGVGNMTGELDMKQQININHGAQMVMKEGLQRLQVRIIQSIILD